MECDGVFLVTCDTLPVGLLLGTMKGEDGVDIMIDYTIPAYRDTSVGAFLHDELPGIGIHTLEFNREAPGHEWFLVKMGYEKTDSGYRLKL